MRSRTRMVLLLAAAVVSLSMPAPLAQAQLATTGINRTVHIRTKHTRPMRGMTCTGPCKIVGGVRTDSYDSDDPAKSSAWMLGWYDPAKAGEVAFIGTTSKTPGDLKITGSARVVGSLGTGAPGVLEVIGNASAGSKSWVDSGASGLQSSGYLQDDLNMHFPEVVLPFTPPAIANPPPPGVFNVTNIYQHVLGSQTYTMDSFNLSGGKAIVTGRAILYVRGNFDISSSSVLIIETNASLDLYVGGNMKMSGGILNKASKAEAFSYFGLPSNTSIDLGGNSTAWVGSIYAPQAVLTFGGSADFYGASISREINLNGTFQYHYDEALSRKGRVFMPTGWKEL